MHIRDCFMSSPTVKLDVKLRELSGASDVS